MTRSVLAVAILAAAACSSKVTWREHKAGPVTLQFPCEPSSSGTVTKCMRSDGTEYGIAVTKRDVPAEQELKEMAEYASTLPKAEVFKGDAFPLRWREVRQFRRLDSWLYFKDGTEYTITVNYSTDELPPTAKEFFEKVAVAQ